MLYSKKPQWSVWHFSLNLLNWFCPHYHKNGLGIIAIINECSIGYVTLATLPVGPSALCQPACGSSSLYPHLPRLPWASVWVSAKWPQEGAVSHTVYLWAVFVWFSRVFACNEQTASSRTTWRTQILSFILAQAAGSWFHVWEPSQVGIFFFRNAISQRTGGRHQRGES